MINTIVTIDEIQYETVAVSQELIDSIKNHGIAIPIQVNQIANGYVCVDGNKRLSARQIISQSDVRFKRIPICILNNFSKSGSGFWGNTQNHH